MAAAGVALLALGATVSDAESPTRSLAACVGRSVAAGRVTYHEIATAFYGDPTESILATKRSYRSRVSDRATWLSDYEGRLDAPVVIEVADAQQREDGLLEGAYSMATNTARITPRARGELLAHEVGHGLAWKPGFNAADKKAFDPDLAALHQPTDGRTRLHGAKDGERLRYLTRQCEFEIRLQALNRFFHLRVGRPIFSPADAVQTLAILSVPMDVDEVCDALARCDAAVSPREVRTMIGARWMENPFDRQQFRDAYDVRVMLELAARVDPAGRRSLLEKIVREAPGHF